ncbi:MAG: ABC-2 transporter permease [Candidatus Niameybacter stercoravium]|nr:ABC-2 transporter permease [Candidatus Niameybacter stercoravium]
MMIVIFLIPLNLFIQYGIKEEVTTETILLLASIGVLLYGGVVAIQIPCYFKWGYTKSKMITAILPVVIGLGTPIVVIGGSKLLGEDVFRNLLGYIETF